MVIIFIVWTLIYTIFYSLYILNKKIDEKELIDRIITGYSHMWYLILTIGLYIMVPIFKRIITTKKATRYFLIVIFIFFSCIPQITNIMLQIIYDFISNIIYQFVTSPNFSIFTFQNDFMIYSGYFVMGYYLNRIQIKKNKRMIIYLLDIKLNINVLTYSPMISIPIMTFTVFLGSFIITNILKKSLLQKKIV